jgi:uncharacterized protein (TIGR02145 family)
MKRILWYHLLTLMVMTGELLFLASCEKNSKDPTVATLPVSQITYCSATVGGNLISEGLGVISWGVCFDTTPNPIYSIYLPTNYESFSGGGLGSHTTIHSGLIENTTYYLRAYVEYYKSLNGQLPQGMTSYGSEVTFKTQKLETIIVFNPNLTYESLSDIEGNTYKTIQIGTQVWMAENLRVTKYRDGSTIQKITDNWGFSDTIGAYCNYGNNDTYVTTFGRLYTYYATVNSHKLCPTGWHVPSDAEWTLLETYLGGSSVAGGKLKEVGTSHWGSPNTGATNESGFTALPGGSRYFGNFYDLGSSGFWWFPNDAMCRYRNILYIDSNVSNSVGPYADRAGDCYSVRCVND